jgi:hypothetical protein
VLLRFVALGFGSLLRRFCGWFVLLGFVAFSFRRAILAKKDRHRPSNALGFLVREGLRRGEVVALRVGIDVTSSAGTIALDENKTDDARMWVQAPGVVAGLSAG